MYGVPGPWPTGRPHDICDTLFDLAVATWQYLDWGSRFDLLPGEETITDNNLLHIQVRHQTRVQTWKLDSVTEGELGADWEWWFGGRGGWFGLRMQAKKLYPKHGSYKSLERKQAARFIRHCALDGLAAFYCFYNSYWPMRSGRPSVGACCSGYRHQETFCCTLVPAFEVYNRVYAGQTRLEAYECASVPWQCLLCCPRARRREQTLSQGVRNAVARLDPFVSDDVREGPLHEVPPEYVGNVLAGEDPTRNLLQLQTQDRVPRDEVTAGLVRLRYITVVRDID